MDLLPPNYVACSDGHGPVYHRDDIDCPACKEISKKLTEVNNRDIEIARLRSCISVAHKGVWDLAYLAEAQKAIGLVLCPECGGAGGVDSGGVTPWGSGINIPCPSCSNERQS